MEVPSTIEGLQEPLPVVASHFCVPNVVTLKVKQHMTLSNGDFTITDANDAVVLRVKSPVCTMHNRRFLSDSAGQRVVCMREKSKCDVFRGDSYNESDLLFTAKKTSMLQLFKTEMDIFLASNTAMEVCDFKMKTTFQDRTCAFYLGNTNTMIAQMHRVNSAANKVL
ncbi:hypothetical protein PR202_ga27932 [Eleusine coracana subsp. coracana]|uniref:Uncharacterized protein n=1 Tax=Eleusine coracana subsp. coracana TaxID=191504 RepID=A0AAV5DFU6_ELECO|nr:hypothetical protein PR202_ga27932 [Eleusine coracana subsp. coracana]